MDHLFGHVGRLFEFCAGPGFIGFALLGLGRADHLVLADVNPAAVAAAQQTVQMNGLEDRVTIYQSDGLKDIPTDERWDLVVSNPPHFSEPYGAGPTLLTDDPGRRLHRDFYQRVGDFLNPGGSLLIQENSTGSSPADFLPMISAGGLCNVRTIWYAGKRPRPFYFLWVKKALPGLSLEEPGVVRLTLRETPEELAEVPAAGGGSGAQRNGSSGSPQLMTGRAIPTPLPTLLRAR